MTLYRQLLIFTVTLFILLFIGVFLEKLQTTRTFLTNQLESHAQDTATSLGLSLSVAMEQSDDSLAETMLNAVFDRGYYRRIAFINVAGETVFEQELEVEFEGVPAWFVRLIPLRTPVAESMLMQGWKQAGTLFVECHPGYAYKTLWETVVQIGLYFIASGVLVVVFGGLGLTYLLKPLKRVEKQAEAICRREYTIQEELPGTRELRRVVVSMNKMTTKVENMFAEQVSIAERLRKSAYTDQLTGLGNRRFIRGQVEAHMENVKGETAGALILVQLVDLQEINEKSGFEVGDQLLKRVAEVVREEVGRINKVALARITGGDFVVFMPEISAEDARELTFDINNGLTRLTTEYMSPSNNIAHIGCVVYEEKLEFGRLLAEADSALHAARQAGPNKTCVTTCCVPGKENEAKGKFWWKDTLEDILHQNDILLYSQPVVMRGERTVVLHQEILSRIAISESEVICAGVFIPFAERMRLVALLDRLVITRLFEMNGSVQGVVAVNISPTSVSDQDFVNWLLTRIKSVNPEILKIIFELPEFGAVQHLEQVKAFSTQVQRAGHAIALDHFGQSFTNFGYLKSLKPEYVKIGGAFTKELGQDQGESKFFLEALCGVAHSLDIKVIVEGVETDEQSRLLAEMNVDALQGYLFGMPEPLG